MSRRTPPRRSKHFSPYFLSTKALTTNPQNQLDKVLVIGDCVRSLLVRPLRIACLIEGGGKLLYETLCDR
ncbi:MAG: hypothetical protein ACYTX0_19445 [Nostoc sp.]